jgi:hypothetical protein
MDDNIEYVTHEYVWVEFEAEQLRLLLALLDREASEGAVAVARRIRDYAADSVSETAQKYRRLAWEHYRDLDLEFDLCSVVDVCPDPTTPGAYVRCWHWVDDPDAAPYDPDDPDVEATNDASPDN